eukprot:3250811-Pyramimonas_sp.AAC.1
MPISCACAACRQKKADGSLSILNRWKAPLMSEAPSVKPARAASRVARRQLQGLAEESVVDRKGVALAEAPLGQKLRVPGHGRIRVPPH